MNLIEGSTHNEAERLEDGTDANSMMLFSGVPERKRNAEFQN
jgi:hypothetical protein